MMYRTGRPETRPPKNGERAKGRGRAPASAAGVTARDLARPVGALCERPPPYLASALRPEPRALRPTP